MLKKIFAPLALVAACALFLTACGGGSNNATTTSNNSSAPANANNKTSTTSTPTTTTTASGDKVGVPECDDFLAKYEACVTGKVPEAARPQFKASVEQWRTAWRKAAENPDTKAALAQTCKATIEQAKTSMKSFNCEF